MVNTQQHDLARTTLSILFIVGLIAASLWILGPFLPALIWATMIAVATWPIMLRVQRMLWGRRSLAVVVMTLALLLVFVIPFSLAIGTVIANADLVVDWAKSIGTVTLPAPPDWLQALPLVGGKASALWRDLAASGPEELARKIAPYAQDVARWFLGQLGTFGMISAQFLLTVIIAAILFASGETVVMGIDRFGQRLAGAQGDHAIRIAGQAIRGVALGVVVVAIGQAVLGGIGLAVAGVPFALILTAAMFMLCIVQIGPAPVLVCAIVWLYWKGNSGWATVLIGWTIAVGTLDNVVRPILIMRGANLPLLLIFSGVVGGLITFGLVGIFVGPMILAVAFMLLGEWVGQEPVEGEDPVRDGPDAT